VITFEMRAMTAGDIDAAVTMYKAGGWGERREFLQWVLANPSTRPLVGVRNGSVVATGMATISGPVGWVGSIFVDRTMRSQGYGRAITEAACEIIDAARCRTHALIASEYGKPLYLDMGFRIVDEYQVMQATTISKAPKPPVGKTLRPMETSDLDQVCDLDQGATGEDRRGLIEGLAGRAWLLEGAGGLLGFLGSVLPDSGAVVAPELEDAAILLEQLRWISRGKVKVVEAVVPSLNAAGIAGLEALGWVATYRTPRLVRGADIPWNPLHIWSILSRAWG
jgi:GNAT superfamily N-acetyltransferase